MFKKIIGNGGAWPCWCRSARRRRRESKSAVWWGGRCRTVSKAMRILAGDGNIYDAVDVKDSASWGLAVGFNATDNVEVGFLFGQQLSKMVLKRHGRARARRPDRQHLPPVRRLQCRDARCPRVRPYLMIGFGATNYGDVDFTRANGRPRRPRADAVLDHLGRRRQGVRRIRRRLPRRRPVDPDLHQVGFGRLVVRPRTGAATWWATRSTQTSSSSTAALYSGSEEVDDMRTRFSGFISVSVARLP